LVEARTGLGEGGKKKTLYPRVERDSPNSKRKRRVDLPVLCGSGEGLASDHIKKSGFSTISTTKRTLGRQSYSTIEPSAALHRKTSQHARQVVSETYWPQCLDVVPRGGNGGRREGISTEDRATRGSGGQFPVERKPRRRTSCSVDLQTAILENGGTARRIISEGRLSPYSLIAKKQLI